MHCRVRAARSGSALSVQARRRNTTVSLKGLPMTDRSTFPTTDRSTSLRWDVHVAPSEPLTASDLAPGEKARVWSPISATLISGERDAVLVDALLTVGQAHNLVEWIDAHGRNLTAVYITHGHGDHWFGLGTVLERFPDARALA